MSEHVQSRFLNGDPVENVTVDDCNPHDDGSSFDSITTMMETTKLRINSSENTTTNNSTTVGSKSSSRLVKEELNDSDLSELKVSPSRNGVDNKISPRSSSSSIGTITPDQKKKRATTHRVQSSGGLVYQSDKKEKAKKVGEFLVFIDCKLGSGSYATVYEGMHEITKQQVAIKVIDKKKLNPSNLKYFSSEIKIMRELDSDYCIRMIDFLETHHNCYVILEYCGGGDLNDLIIKRSPLLFHGNGRMKERFLKKMIYQLSEGVEYLHRKQIMHRIRDLKPANLLFSKTMEIIDNEEGDFDIDFGFLKVADLGLAKELESNNLAQTVCGTPLFMAPEIMHYVSGGPVVYDVRADLWSVGVIIYYLCYGHLPFIANDLYQQYHRMKNGASFPTQDTSPELIDLLKGLLKVEPSTRFDFKQFYNHPYIVNIRNEQQKSCVKLNDIQLSSFEDEYDIIDPLEIQEMPITPEIDINSTDISETSAPSPVSSTSTATQQSTSESGNNSIILFDEKVEFNTDLFISKKFTIQSSLELYPQIIFDFSGLTSSTDDKITLDNAERNIQISWVIAEMALNFERTFKVTESFALYMRASQLLQNCGPFLSELQPSERKTALSAFINHFLNDIFKRMEKLHSKTKQLDPTKSKDITNVMYLSAIELTKEACCWEMIGYSKWTSLYNRAFYLLSYLSELTKDNKEDNTKISHLIKIIQQKLNKQ